MICKSLASRARGIWAEGKELNRQRDLADAIERGRKLVGEGRADAEPEFFADAVARFPEDAEVRLLSASHLAYINPAAAIAEVERAIELEPDDPIKLTRAAQIVLRFERFELARQFVQRARELIVSPEFLFMPEVWVLEGEIALYDGNEDSAEQSFRRAVESEPEAEQFALRLSRLMAHQGRVDEALEVIDRAIERTGQDDLLAPLREQLLADRG